MPPVKPTPAPATDQLSEDKTHIDEAYHLDDPGQHYDEWADSYDKDVADEGYEGPRSMAEMCRVYLKNSERILEVGAGSGLVGMKLQDLGYSNLDALEPSTKMLDLARERGVYRQYFVDMLSETDPCSIPDSSYDALISQGCFIPHHLNTNHFPELIRMVRPGGKIILGVNERMTVYSEDPDQYFPYDIDASLKALQDQGSIKLLARQRKPYLTARTPGIYYVFQVE